MVGHSGSTDTKDGTDAADLGVDVAYDLLADQRRRHVLACLADQTNSIPLDDLAKDVAGRENEAPSAEIPDDEVETISLSLHHTHLPKLAAAGVVDYDPDRDRVRAWETAGRVEQVRSRTVAIVDDPAGDRCQINLGWD